MSFGMDYVWQDASDGQFTDQHNRHSLIRDVQAINHPRSLMDEISRHELDAKLEAIEARIDARLARMEVIVERSASDVQAVEKAAGNFKWWAIGTAIAAVVGLYGANVSLLSGFQAAFESGRNIGHHQGQQSVPNPQGAQPTAPARRSP